MVEAHDIDSKASAGNIGVGDSVQICCTTWNIVNSTELWTWYAISSFTCMRERERGGGSRDEERVQEREEAGGMKRGREGVRERGKEEEEREEKIEEKSKRRKKLCLLY